MEEVAPLVRGVQEGGGVQAAVVALTGLGLIAPAVRIVKVVTTGVAVLIAITDLSVRAVASVQAVQTTRAVLTAVGALIAMPVQAVPTTRAGSIVEAVLIATLRPVEVVASPGEIAKSAAIASAATTGPVVVAASRKKGR